MYKCLWTAINDLPKKDTLKDSTNDALEFNEPYNEDEIKAQIEAKLEDAAGDDDESKEGKAKV